MQRSGYYLTCSMRCAVTSVSLPRCYFVSASRSRSTSHRYGLRLRRSYLVCAGVQAAARNAGYPTKTSAHYSYTNALHKSLIFVETMRSGVLPRWRVAWCAADPLLAFYALLAGCSPSISFA